jgi:hypothetical protein
MRPDPSRGADHDPDLPRPDLPRRRHDAGSRRSNRACTRDRAGSVRSEPAGRSRKGHKARSAGTWSGQLNQVGSATPFKFAIAISAKGAQTTYSDLDCTGKLTRAGSSKSYVFFVEIITKGRADKSGRCPDGTITVTREGDTLALGWFGNIQGNTIVAYGTLSKN